MTKKPARMFELCTEKLETLEDVKKIFKALQIRIDNSNPLYEELKYYFTVEVVPKGYIRLLEEVGHKKIEQMTYEEMEEKISKLPNEETN